MKAGGRPLSLRAEYDRDVAALLAPRVEAAETPAGRFALIWCSTMAES